MKLHFNAGTALFGCFLLGMGLSMGCGNNSSGSIALNNSANNNTSSTGSSGGSTVTAGPLPSGIWALASASVSATLPGPIIPVGTPTMTVGNNGATFQFSCTGGGTIDSAIMIDSNGNFSVQGNITVDRSASGPIPVGSPAPIITTPATFSGQVTETNGVYSLSLQIVDSTLIISPPPPAAQYIFVLGASHTPFACPVAE